MRIAFMLVQRKMLVNEHPRQIVYNNLSFFRLNHKCYLCKGQAFIIMLENGIEILLTRRD